MPVMCKNCGIRPAKIHYTEIVDNNMETMDLCIECADEKGIDVTQSTKYGLGDLVAGLIDNAAASEGERIGKVRCPSCGYDYSDFKKVGRFGCPECYAAFETQLLPLLRQLHGSTQHEGKAPAKLGEKAVIRKELLELRDQLSEAIESEAYERAAQIRDRINELENQVDAKE